MNFSSLKLIVTMTLGILTLAGCTLPKTTLMPTPVLFYNADVDPFSHLKPEQKNIRTKIFYATNRTPIHSKEKIIYSNKLDSHIHIGTATIRMGKLDSTWGNLYAASLSETRSEPIPLTLEKVVELSKIPINVTASTDILVPGLKAFLTEINTELVAATDKDIMIYIHGTKTDFAKAALITSEIDHFTGRDFVGISFAWPSHQNIISYLTGTDVHHAQDSSTALQQLLILLAKHTTAEHINILAYSAGSKTASKALFELRQTVQNLDQQALKKKFRLGAIAFTAADVKEDVFFSRLPAISDLAQRVVITLTDNDIVLRAAEILMGGTSRIGSSAAENNEKKFIIENHLSNIEILDISMDHVKRGFDISGHHYWYKHPWVSSDIIFLMRTDLPPSRRGLSLSREAWIWYFSPDYPEKVRRVINIELIEEWRSHHNL